MKGSLLIFLDVDQLYVNLVPVPKVPSFQFTFLLPSLLYPHFLTRLANCSSLLIVQQPQAYTATISGYYK
jgi:hypothetical protein